VLLSGAGVSILSHVDVPNEVGSCVNWTVSGSFRLRNGTEFFAVINNVLDEDPKIAPPLTTVRFEF